MQWALNFYTSVSEPNVIFCYALHFIRVFIAAVIMASMCFSGMSLFTVLPHWVIDSLRICSIVSDGVHALLLSRMVSLEEWTIWQKRVIFFSWFSQIQPKILIYYDQIRCLTRQTLESRSNGKVLEKVVRTFSSHNK